MIQLHITRHGKSSWDYENISDIDRPLNVRGINNSYMMAKRLADREVVPDLLISSPATRALSTAVIFIRAMNLPPAVLQINDALYTGYADEMTELIKSIDNNYSNVMLFGHNPAFTVLANRFLAGSVDNIPTAGIVSMSFETDKWTDIEGAVPVAEFFDYPKRL
jgi:phosphohistidine phosphatase